VTDSNPKFEALSRAWMLESANARYSYGFSWLGRPIIQYPQDICAIQELVWAVKPDLVIETGIAHGGSLILSASLLALLDLCEAAEAGQTIDPLRPKRKVLGVDIDIRAHNRAAIEAHPLAGRIEIMQGSSIDPEIVEAVRSYARDFDRILVCLDSMHTHAHVLSELQSYANLVTVGSYCVVFDTIIDDLPRGYFPDRPWDVGNNPKTAVREFLSHNDSFELDRTIEQKLAVTVAPEGFLKRVK
jgi:cephalosporin hydroxylase